MMAAKSEEIRNSQKNYVTMDRKVYRQMLQDKSAEISGTGKIEVISSEERKKNAKEKSEEIADYRAGYLNSAEERRARIRSFFYPGQYQANTPSEKKNKMREKSNEIARFEGKVQRRKFNSRMHPSSRYLGKFYLASMSERSDFHRKTTIQLAKSRKEYLPVYLKERPQKPRYNRDVEKGLWAE